MNGEKVVGLLGRPVPVPKGEPVPEIVEMLEWALNEARNGNMRAAGLAYAIHDLTSSPMAFARFFAAPGEGQLLENAVMVLFRWVGRWLDE